MTDLVYGLFLFASQISSVVNRLFLQKVPNLVAGVQEVVVANVIVIAGRELGLKLIQ